jgi:hypothetical protein
MARTFVRTEEAFMKTSYIPSSPLEKFFKLDEQISGKDSRNG